MQQKRRLGSDNKHFDSDKTQKMELSSVSKQPNSSKQILVTPVREDKEQLMTPQNGLVDSTNAPQQHQRKKSNLTLNMGLIENYEPEHINFEKIETQKRKVEQLSAQGKSTNGKSTHQNGNNPHRQKKQSINILEPQLELEAPRITYSPDQAKNAARNLFSNLQVSSGKKLQYSQSGQKQSQSIEISIRKSEDKLNLLSSIFKIMDRDGDGEINDETLDLSGIPTDMLEYLEDNLLEIHQSKSPITFLNFVDIVDRYNLIDDLHRVSLILSLIFLIPFRPSELHRELIWIKLMELE